MTRAPKPIQVVVAYDFSPSADEALIRAVDVAARAPQHVLHVVGALDHSGPAIGAFANVDYRHPDYQTADHVQAMISERMRAAFAGRPTASEVHFFVHARIGKPATEILAVAEEVGADLIFIGSHGKTGVERFLLGSVSERVVREAKCPVMVARPKTYRDVELLDVVAFDHARVRFTPPHRYSYVDNRVIKRPDDWPLQ